MFLCLLVMHWPSVRGAFQSVMQQQSTEENSFKAFECEQLPSSTGGELKHEILEDKIVETYPV